MLVYSIVVVKVPSQILSVGSRIAIIIVWECIFMESMMMAWTIDTNPIILKIFVIIIWKIFVIVCLEPTSIHFHLSLIKVGLTLIPVIIFYLFITSVGWGEILIRRLWTTISVEDSVYCWVVHY